MSASTLASMAWRRALKHFHPVKTQNKLGLDPILKAAVLAPSSFGIQPFQIYVISCPKTLARISPTAYNQPQITECEHLLLFAARKDAKGTIERCIEYHNFDKTAPQLATSIRNSLGGMDEKAFLQYSSNQAHIALGFALVAAADLRIGSCPMGGFDSEKMGSVLGLAKNESVVALMAVGTAPKDEEDKQANPHPKFRFNVDHIVTHVASLLEFEVRVKRDSLDPSETKEKK